MLLMTGANVPPWWIYMAGRTLAAIIEQQKYWT